MDRKLATLIFALAFALGMAGVADSARAAGGTDKASGFALAVALEADELAKNRGAGLDSAMPEQEAEGPVAVILWDEFKRPPAGGTVRVDSGIGTSFTSSISGSIH